MMLNYGDDSAIPVPALFMFVPGMPAVVNHNTHQGLKLVNGARYMAVDIVVDKMYPGYYVSPILASTSGRQQEFSWRPTRRKDFIPLACRPGLSC
jgi:hypothetical protein